jgi:carbon storage regulator CsrA
MLVLSSKRNEEIVISEPGGLLCYCRVTVLSIRGSRVRLGIEADAQTTVRRAEVVARIRPDGQFGNST